MPSLALIDDTTKALLAALVGLFISYGFPSGPALVTVVACGLVAWALGRDASRLILDAHWPGDVIGGLAFGAGWPNLVVAVAGCAVGTAGADTAFEAAFGGS